ncbi:MAG: hypothetical protein AAGC55_24970, partial [Myxococcota bacterium]
MEHYMGEYSNLAWFLVACVALFALLVGGAHLIQLRRRNRLRGPWREAAAKLGGELVDDRIAVERGDLRLKLAFCDASLAKPGR